MKDKNHELYSRWHTMHARCYQVGDKNYRYYGLHGIIVCKEWHRFKAFRDWFNNEYEKASDYIRSIAKRNVVVDRIDPKGNYEPNNCRLITNSENSKRAIHMRDKYGRFVSVSLSV